MSWIKWIVKNKKENKVAKKKTRRKNKYLKIGNFKIKKKVAIIVICVLVAVVAFILFRTSYLWPWPSQSEIDQRLVDVIDGCMYNEDSRACKSLQSRYNMSFEYCYALSDIPEINVAIPVYGVVKVNSFTASSLNYQPASKGSTLSSPYPSSGDKLTDNVRNAASGGYSMQIGERGDSKYPYYGCVKSIDEIAKQKGSSLISNPETIALFGLSKIPQYSVTYGLQGEYGCKIHRSSINNLWTQIPNMAAIQNEVNNILNMYPYCSMKEEIDRSISDLNTKLDDYANNYSVQLFYQKYDEWAARDGAGCTWYDKKFDNQLCGAASNGESPGSDVMVKDFAADMHRYLHTKYFTSKIVVRD